MWSLSKEVKSTTQPQTKGHFKLLYEAVVVMIVWLLDIHLHVQSVHITTNVVSSNPAQVRCTRYIIICPEKGVKVRIMILSATFNNISVIS
jgi:hypothetical protein